MIHSSFPHHHHLKRTRHTQSGNRKRILTHMQEAFSKQYYLSEHCVGCFAFVRRNNEGKVDSGVLLSCLVQTNLVSSWSETSILYLGRSQFPDWNVELKCTISLNWLNQEQPTHSPQGGALSTQRASVRKPTPAASHKPASGQSLEMTNEWLICFTGLSYRNVLFYFFMKYFKPNIKSQDFWSIIQFLS